MEKNIMMNCQNIDVPFIVFNNEQVLNIEDLHDFLNAIHSQYGNDAMGCVYVRITKKAAKEFYAKYKNPNNRTVEDKGAKLLRREFNNNEFETDNGECVKVTKNGMLTDFHHRLFAFITSDLPDDAEIIIPLMFGVRNSSKLDTGTKRTPLQNLAMSDPDATAEVIGLAQSWVGKMLMAYQGILDKTSKGDDARQTKFLGFMLSRYLPELSKFQNAVDYSKGAQNTAGNRYNNTAFLATLFSLFLAGEIDTNTIQTLMMSGRNRTVILNKQTANHLIDSTEMLVEARNFDIAAFGVSAPLASGFNLLTDSIKASRKDDTVFTVHRMLECIKTGHNDSLNPVTTDVERAERTRCIAKFCNPYDVLDTSVLKEVGENNWQVIYSKEDKDR